MRLTSAGWLVTAAVVGEVALMRASTLVGRAILLPDRAQTLGTVEDVLIDPVAGEVVALVSRRYGVFRWAYPMAQVARLEPDAVTIDRSRHEPHRPSQGKLVTLAAIVGREVFTGGGGRLGVVNDLRLDDEGRRILGYEVVETQATDAAQEPASLVDRAQFVSTGPNLRSGPVLLVL